MTQMTFVCLYRDYMVILDSISDVARGKLVKAMLHYAFTGEEIPLTGTAKVLWTTFRSQIDRDQENYQKKYDRNRINGSKGGRPRKNPPVSEKPKKPKDNDNKIDIAIDTDIDIDSDTDIENDSPAPACDSLSPSGYYFTPPTVEDVRNYCLSQGFTIDTAGFVDYYTSNGWMVGNRPMMDWQAAARNWARKERQYGKTGMERTQPIYGHIL